MNLLRQQIVGYAQFFENSLNFDDQIASPSVLLSPFLEVHRVITNESDLYPIDIFNLPHLHQV